MKSSLGLSSLLRLLSSHKRRTQFFGALPEHPDGDKDPQDVKEHKVKPEVDRMTGFQLRARGEPLRRKGHESTVQFGGRKRRRNKPQFGLGGARSGRRCAAAGRLPQEVAYVESRRTAQENRQ